MQKAYNDCVNGLLSLRRFHLGIVRTYIIDPSQKQHGGGSKSEKPSENRGTGGTDLMSFLKSVTDATKEVLLNSASV